QHDIEGLILLLLLSGVEARESVAGTEQQCAIAFLIEAGGIDIVPQEPIAMGVTSDLAIAPDAAEPAIAADPDRAGRIATDHENVVARQSILRGQVLRRPSVAEGDVRNAKRAFLIDSPDLILTDYGKVKYQW